MVVRVVLESSGGSLMAPLTTFPDACQSLARCVSTYKDNGQQTDHSLRHL